MKLSQIILLAYKNLMVKKSRTIFTVAGVVIGIGAIMFLVSLGYGLQKLVTEQVVQFDAFYIVDVTAGDSNVIKLGNESKEKIQGVTLVDRIGSGIDLAGKVKIGSSATDAVFYAVDKNFTDFEKISVDEGSFMSMADNSKDIVLSKSVLNLLGVKDTKALLGQEISSDLIVTKNLTSDGNSKNITDQKFRLVGIINDENLPYAYIPIQTALNSGAANYSSLKVKIKDKDKVDVLRKTIENMGYKTDHVSDTLTQINQIFSILKIALGITGFIAMVVALLGMFNTLTISLLERMREVGYLKIIGARNRDIFLLFSVESILIGILGGIFGIIIGFIIQSSINSIISTMAVKYGAFPIKIFFTPTYFALAMFGFALIIGFLTGLYPARRAVRVKPLDVLRYE